MRITHRIGIALAAAAAFTLAGAAQAVQFTPPTSARLHTVFSGGAGTTWTTGTGQIEYASGQLAVDAEIDVLNYFDPFNGSCPTDGGPSCTFNFGAFPNSNLDLSVLANYLGASFVDQGDGYFDITLHFGTTGGTDIIWTDPTDSTQVLRGSWVAGDFLGSPTTGLEVVATYCNGGACGAAGLQGTPTVIGFSLLDNATLYSTLFDSGTPMRFALNVDQVFVSTPSLDEIAQTLYESNGATLVDFTASGQGQIFRLETGDFVVPEPSTALLLGLGLLGLGAVRRRENS